MTESTFESRSESRSESKSDSRPQCFALALIGLGLLGCGAPPTPSASLQPVGELHAAAYAGDVARLERTSFRGAALEAHEVYEWTPLHYAAIGGQVRAALWLLDRGADPNARGRYDLTPLHWASLKANHEVVALLVQRGAKIDAVDMYGQTALHAAGSTEVVDALLAHGARLDATDFEGMTPLHVAKSGDIAKLLLARGADLRVRSRDGRTGLDVAVMEMLGPLGLMFFGPRAAVRIKTEVGRVMVTVRNISERAIPKLRLEVRSEACRGASEPRQIDALLPGQQAELLFHLRRAEGVPEGEYRLDFEVSSGAALLGLVDLRVDTTTATTPEDLGMTRLGRGSLRPAGSRWGQLLFAIIPMIIAATWLFGRWWRSRAGDGHDESGGRRAR